MNVTVQVVGGDRVIGALHALQIGAAMALRKQVEESAKAIRTAARARVKRRSGKTAKSIRIKYTPDRLGAEIKVDWFVGHLLEFGTAPHPITRGQKWRGNQRTVAQHPGTPPAPFLFPAWEAERPNYERGAAEALRGEVSRASR